MNVLTFPFSGVAQDYTLEIARGKIEGSEAFNAYGEITSSLVGTNNLLWADGDWSIPDQIIGEQMQFQSTSVEDSAAGTGIRTLRVSYLDSALIPQVEDITLNGTTAVTTTATDIRFVQCAHMLTAGSTKAAVGTITVTNIGATAKYNQMSPEYVRCSSSARMVPAGKRAVIAGVIGSCTSGASKDAKISIASTYFDDISYVSQGILVPFGSIAMQDTGIPYNFPVPPIFPEGEIIALTYSSANAGLLITGDWFGWTENSI